MNISKRFSHTLLYENCSFNLKSGERIGLVGANGCGKTTLLNIIAGAQSPDSGEIAVSKNFRIGILEQEFEVATNKTVLETVKESVFKNELDIDHLREKISAEKNPAQLEALLKIYSGLEAEFEASGGYNIENNCKKILSGLGITEEMMYRKSTHFSGGQRMRIGLAKLLASPFDAILLDEPTNHLDLPSLLWFENYLRSYPGLIVIISHDQTLLNNIVTKVVEISNRKITVYHGNYQKYREQKSLVIEQLESAKKQYERERKETERFIERFRYKNTKAKQVQSRLKNLEKTEQDFDIPKEESQIKFSFPQPERSGYEVVKVNRVDKRYGDIKVLENFSFEIKRGEKIAVTGKNGTGKSTLMKIMAGIIKADCGSVSLGTNVKVGYFSQIHAEQLNLNNTIIDEMESIRGARSTTDVRKLLGRFFFTGDDVFKKIAVLSGGEKSRVLLTRLLLSASNFLLLDEPTNHLDIPSQSVIIEALKNFTGTVCFVSHDRYLINNIATRLLDFEENGVCDYPGTYDEYKSWQERNLSQSEFNDDQKAVNKRKEQKRQEAEERNLKYKKRKVYDERIAEIELKLETSMEEETELEQQLGDPDIYKDEDKAKYITDRYKTVKQQIENLTHKWEELSLEREKLL